jgi:hypothetical protein
MNSPRELMVSKREPLDSEKFANWESQIELVAKSIGENAQGYKFMHIDAARNEVNMYDKVMYLSLIVGPLEIAVNALGMLLNPDGPILVPTIAIVLGFLTTVFISIVKFGEFNESAVSHKRAASEYTSLESNVRRQMALPRDVRIDAVAYVNWLGLSYDRVFTGAPLISQKIVDRYTKVADSSGVSIPTLKDVVIDVNTDYEGCMDKMLNADTIHINTCETSELCETPSVESKHVSPSQMGEEDDEDGEDGEGEDNGDGEKD